MVTCRCLKLKTWVQGEGEGGGGVVVIMHGGSFESINPRGRREGGGRLLRGVPRAMTATLAKKKVAT